VAQTTVLIGVNPYLREYDLKKQSQLSRIACCILRAAKWSLEKQSQFKANFTILRLCREDSGKKKGDGEAPL
jgi:hypothetical protein